MLHWSDEDDDIHQIVAMIRIELFRQFVDFEAEAMIRSGKVGSDRDCQLVVELGPALRDRETESLEAVADPVATCMPDLAERCRSIAGVTYADIADDVGVAVRTVEGHACRCYRNLDIAPAGRSQSRSRVLLDLSGGAR